ncbi:MAG TPA: hypothetical protein VLA30_10225, partial [Burkholderiales bacterium]|nr:hypothetical protein [Burkholderiales bacterium]
LGGREENEVTENHPDRGGQHTEEEAHGMTSIARQMPDDLASRRGKDRVALPPRTPELLWLLSSRNNMLTGIKADRRKAAAGTDGRPWRIRTADQRIKSRS